LASDEPSETISIIISIDVFEASNLNTHQSIITIKRAQRDLLYILFAPSAFELSTPMITMKSA
jgi:hypothetical protein